MSMEETWYYSISATAFLLLTVLERAYNQALFDYSIETIPQMQADELTISM